VRRTLDAGGKIMRSRKGFTLVELLVVIAIIAVLASLIMSSLEKARERVRDTHCAATMHQTMIGITMYNNDYPEGLQSYHPDCPAWGQGWGTPPSKTTGHFLWDKMYVDTGPSFYHSFEEARGQASWWRGYLIGGGYLKYMVTGCSFTEYTGGNSTRSMVGGILDFNASYNHDMASGANHVETAANGDDFKRSPAFIWYGPGSMAQETRTWAGQSTGPDWGIGYECASFTLRGREPLLTCPPVYFYNNIGGSLIHRWEPTHRERYYGWKNNAVWVKHPPGCAMNVGFTDSSVEFFENEAGGSFYPL